MADIIRPPPSPSSFAPCISPGANDSPDRRTLLDHRDSLADCNFANLYRRYCAGARVGEGEHLSVLALLFAVFRRPSAGCRKTATGLDGPAEVMEIGWPSNVRHVAHVTFDRFDGFLGLPVEFEPEVPRKPPSASTRVFGVSTESMQLSFDFRGNCVPTILLMMQRRLYSQGGLESEGIFRINPANGHEEYAREQLNNGLIPDNIDVHCLAGLIKAWFRELPTGVLDSLSPEQVMGAQSEDECVHLLRLLPPTESSLMDWAINLMADVAQLAHLNKMNAHNIAMVFAPNMTQMLDPLIALMYAVQVMNFLKTLIVKTLRERDDSIGEPAQQTHIEPSNEDRCQNHTVLKPIIVEEACDLVGKSQDFVGDYPPTRALNSRESGKKIQPRIGRMKLGRRSNTSSVKKGLRNHNPRPAAESSETIRDIIVGSSS